MLSFCQWPSALIPNWEMLRTGNVKWCSIGFHMHMCKDVFIEMLIHMLDVSSGVLKPLGL